MNNVLNSVTLFAASGVSIKLLMMIFIVLLMGLFALGILAYVLLKSRERKFSLGGFFSFIFSAILVLTVVMMIVVLLSISAPQFVEQAATIDHRIKAEDLIAEVSSVKLSETTIPVTESEASVEKDPNLPKWVGQPNSLSSEQFATVEEAESKILSKAILRIQKDFHKTYPYKGDWAIPDGLVKKHYLLSQPYVEKITRHTENATFEVVRVHCRLTLSPAAHKKLYPVWRKQIVNRRLWTLGSLLGVFTLVLGATATYLRLDAATSGAYRLRLKLATVALIVAGGMGVAMMLPVG